MYICVKKSLPSHKCLIPAHASLMCHLKFAGKADYQKWLNKSFRKVVCEVSDAEFELLKLEQDYIVITESAFGNAECGLAFCPRPEWPEIFKKLELLRL